MAAASKVKALWRRVGGHSTAERLDLRWISGLVAVPKAEIRAAIGQKDDGPVLKAVLVGVGGEDSATSSTSLAGCPHQIISSPPPTLLTLTKISAGAATLHLDEPLVSILASPLTEIEDRWAAIVAEGLWITDLKLAQLMWLTAKGGADVDRRQAICELSIQG